MSKSNIYERTIRHWERDILGKLERAKEIKGSSNHTGHLKSLNNRTMKINWGEASCPLCPEFFCGELGIYCGCPLIITKTQCVDTPWSLFNSAMQNRDLPEAIKYARVMIAFMKKRFKKLGLI